MEEGGIVKKEEILELNRKCSRNSEDEREQYIEGKAGILAKAVFLLLVIIITIINDRKGLPSQDIKTIFFAYCASMEWYRCYYLKHKSDGIFAFLATIAAILNFIQFLKL